ncbi:ABC transporter substrate-binding protein [Naumannella halotolerans]|uniref:ABC transporter substrate-binding protein n=1 Tax=Naumannella halotolerans TaxID=993414 RepID=UPI00370D99D7
MTRFARPAIGAVSASLLILAVAGCAGGSTAADEPDADNAFSFALASDPSCLNPRVAGNNDAAYPSRQLVDSLTDQDPETGEIVPWLAESFEANDDATEYTFHLREGVTFSDGTPLTAEIVKQNFDEVIANGAEQPTSLQFLTDYAETEVVDELTAKVIFDEPNAPFLQATASHFLGLLAPSSLETAPADRCQDNLIGTGPFVLDHYTPNTEVVETRREDYAWGSSLWEDKDTAAASSQLEFKIIPESGVRTGSLRSGQVDAIGGVPAQDEENLASSGFTIQSRANPGQVFSWTVNTNRPITADPLVRQAISKAVDRQAVVDAVLSPSFPVATSTLAATTPGWTDLSAQLTTDVAAANQLLDEAGWVPGADGIREKDGQRLSLKAIWATNFNPNQPALELLQQQLRTVGVEVELSQFEIGQLREVQATGDFDLSWGNSTRPDPDILRSIYYGNADLGIDDDQLAEAIATEVSTADTEVRYEAAATTQRIIVEQAYGIPVFELTTVLGLAEGVQGVRFDSYSRLQLHGAKAEG